MGDGFKQAQDMTSRENHSHHDSAQPPEQAGWRQVNKSSSILTIKPLPGDERGFSGDDKPVICSHSKELGFLTMC